MRRFFACVAHKESRKQYLTTIIALYHSNETIMNRIASCLLAFYICQFRINIFLQDTIFDAFLTIGDLSILPALQLLVFCEMQTVAIEKACLIKQSIQLLIIMKRITRRQQIITQVSQMIIDTCIFRIPILIIHQQINSLIRCYLLCFL